MAKIFVLVALIGCALQVTTAETVLPPFQPIPSIDELNLPTAARNSLDAIRTKINQMGSIVQDQLESVLNKLQEAVTSVTAKATGSIEAETQKMEALIKDASGKSQSCADMATTKLSAFRDAGTNSVRSFLTARIETAKEILQRTMKLVQDRGDTLKGSMSDVKACASTGNFIQKGICVAKIVTSQMTEYATTDVAFMKNILETTALLSNLRSAITTCPMAETMKVALRIGDLGVDLAKCVASS